MVTRDTLITDLEKNIPQTDRVFVKLGMGHIGTLLAFFNTLEEIALYYDVDPDILLDELNEMPEIEGYVPIRA